MSVLHRVFTPKNRQRFAWILLAVCLVGYPVTALTVFKDEPPGILGLSWFALIFTAIDILFTTEVENGKK